MSPKELKKLKADLGKVYRAKYELALALGVDPSKVTKALDGLVKSRVFMVRLEAKAKNILRVREAEAV